MNNNPIGVFDSGVGGLTCLKELGKFFPFLRRLNKYICSHSPSTPSRGMSAKVSPPLSQATTKSSKEMGNQ